MKQEVAISKTVILKTRDFWGESVALDGTLFQISPKRGAQPDLQLQAWWHQHRYDKARGVFATEEPSDWYLACADQTEAVALLSALQQEYDKVAV